MLDSMHPQAHAGPTAHDTAATGATTMTTTTSAHTACIVMTAAAQMPNSCWGKYRRVAVVEVELVDGAPVKPKMISARARGVVAVRATWEKLNVGHTARCAFQRAVAEAEELAAEINADRARLAAC